MARGICLIKAGVDGPGLEELFLRSGLEVWTPHTAQDARIYTDALCVVIDMPRDSGYRTLRLLRDYGIRTPVLLVVDPGQERSVSQLGCGGVMDVIPRDASPLRALRWVQSLCAASTVIEQAFRLTA